MLKSEESDCLKKVSGFLDEVLGVAERAQMLKSEDPCSSYEKASTREGRVEDSREKKVEGSRNSGARVFEEMFFSRQEELKSKEKTKIEERKRYCEIKRDSYNKRVKFLQEKVLSAKVQTEIQKLEFEKVANSVMKKHKLAKEELRIGRGAKRPLMKKVKSEIKEEPTASLQTVAGEKLVTKELPRDGVSDIKDNLQYKIKKKRTYKSGKNPVFNITVAEPKVLSSQSLTPITTLSDTLKVKKESSPETTGVKTEPMDYQVSSRKQRLQAHSIVSNLMNVSKPDISSSIRVTPIGGGHKRLSFALASFLDPQTVTDNDPLSTQNMTK